MLNLSWQPPTLETPRLILRPLSEDDAVDVFLYSSNPNITRYTLFNTHESIDDTLIFLRDYAASRYTAKEPDPLGITMKSDPTKSVIGAVGAFWHSKKDGIMEIGYALAEPYWGRGIIVEACTELIDFLFRFYELNRLQARVIEDNQGSVRVAEKLGMSLDGTLRDYLLHRGVYKDIWLYSLLRSEWDARESLGFAKPHSYGLGRFT